MEHVRMNLFPYISERFPVHLPRFHVERLLCPIPQHFSFANPVPGLLPFPGNPATRTLHSVHTQSISPVVVQSRFIPPVRLPTFTFTQDDIDTFLYGYTKQKGPDSKVSGHALSGLRSCDLSYGIDRILSTGNEKGAYTSTPNGQTTSANPNGITTKDIELPEGLAIRQTTFAGIVHYGVFCNTTVIPRGTKYGPFKGRVINTSEIKTNDDNSFMWEIFDEGKLSHFIDGRGNNGNWMAFVNCARYAQEQNLVALQVERDVYYEVCKDITQGTELLVWYGDCYLQFMGVPVAQKEISDGGAQNEPDTNEAFSCERCGKVFAYKYYRDKHLKYTRCVDHGDRKYPCHLCSRSFEKRDRLRIHILHVHEKHRPHKCVVCGKSFSQSSSLNKHMRVHSGERPYKCVYCNKAFTASSILRTHIRQHSGEKPFKCKHCGKAFASHAAHDSHVRRTHSRERSCICSVCGKAYGQACELKFHMTVHAKK